MRFKSWFLTFALLAVLFDVAYGRATSTAAPGGDADSIHALDGGNGRPPSPQP